MSKLEKLIGREVLDSRGNPTLEVEAYADSGEMARALVPSGASTGSFEALELRDKDSGRYLGKGVLKAVSHVNTRLNQELKGFFVDDQEKLDKYMIDMDGTENKKELGANTMLGVSLAVARLHAAVKKQPLYKTLGQLYGIESPKVLPVPMMNVINGGAHAGNSLDIQEFMITPIGFDSFKEALRAGVEVFHHLKKILVEHDYTTDVGDEGGYAPSLKENKEAWDLLSEAVKQAGYRVGSDFFFACDAASNEFYHEGSYHLDGAKRSATEVIDYYKTLGDRYPLFSIEDGLFEEAWDDWKALTATVGDHMQLVGDDLFVTNPKRLQRGIDSKAANAILIKLNQIGTLSETLATIRMARDAGFNTVISHRSGETEDTFIADLAVATEAGQIKTGSLCRTDRVAKYNQLLRIEEELADSAVYSGRRVLK